MRMKIGLQKISSKSPKFGLIIIAHIPVNHAEKSDANWAQHWASCHAQTISLVNIKFSFFRNKGLKKILY